MEDFDPSNFISPCGLIAWSVFNDSYALFRTSDAKPIKLDEKGKRAPLATTARASPLRLARD